MSERTILIGEADMKKLRRVIEARHTSFTRDQHHLEMLERELDCGQVVRSDEIPRDVVTMHSLVLIRDLDTQEEITYMLVFPAAADIAARKISVLAPIGTALLGYREGDVIEWPVPGGLRRLQVNKVLYQPEAAGDEIASAMESHRPAPVFRAATRVGAKAKRERSVGESKSGGFGHGRKRRFFSIGAGWKFGCFP